MVSKYTTPDYTDDNVDGIINYGQFGRCVYRANTKWDSGVKRIDTILFEESKHSAELNEDLNFSSTIDSHSQQAIKDLIIKYLDVLLRREPSVLF